MSVEVLLPQPKIKVRPINQHIHQDATQSGLTPLLATIVAGRNIPMKTTIEDFLMPKLQGLSSPFLMADMQKAADRLSDAIINGEVIALETDHDCDGQTSHAVLYHCLHQHFCVAKKKIC